MATILTQVRLATTANVVLATNLTIGVSKIDNVIVATNDRILVKAQTNAVENGIYTLDSLGALVRASDWSGGTTQTSGTLVFVQEGDTFADTGWIVSTDGTITVGTTATTWSRFSLNLKLSSADLPSSIILRKEKGYPLTNDELDNNFKYLSSSLTEKLDTALFTGTNISTALALMTAQNANLNSWLLRDKAPAESATASTVAIRTSSGDLYASTFFGNLSGNSTTSTSSTYATTSGNISGSGVVSLTNGGTGSNTASGARASLGAVNIAGDTLTGKLIFAAATTERAALRIVPSAAVVSAPVSGDIWVNSDNLLFRTSTATRTVAFTDSPAFTGSPTVPTADITSNGVAIASTAYVQLHRAVVDAAIALKANIASPALTGTPTAPTPATSDNSTKLATTAYTVAKVADALSSYSNTVAMNAAITAALTSYSSTTSTTSAINTALTNYYTKSQIDTTFAGYSTTVATTTAITNAVSPKANTTYVDGLQEKWGASRKFVQSATPSSPVNGDFWFKI